MVLFLVLAFRLLTADEPLLWLAGRCLNPPWNTVFQLHFNVTALSEVVDDRIVEESILVVLKFLDAFAAKCDRPEL